MFQLIDKTTVRLTDLNPRTEKHGNADVDAVDIGMQIEGENRKVLSLLDPKLCDALYFDEDADQGQQTAEGVETSVPNLRFPKLSQAVTWEADASGVDLTVIYGLGDDKSNIKLEGGKSSVKKFEVKEGGTSIVHFKYSISGYPDGVLDKLRKKLKQEITITMVRPEKLRADAVIDGSVGHPGAAAAQKEKAAAEAAGQGTLDMTKEFVKQHGEGQSGEPAAEGSGDGQADDNADFEAAARQTIEKARASKAALDSSGNSPFPKSEKPAPAKKATKSKR